MKYKGIDIFESEKFVKEEWYGKQNMAIQRGPRPDFSDL